MIQFLLSKPNHKFPELACIQADLSVESSLASLLTGVSCTKHALSVFPLSLYFLAKSALEKTAYLHLSSPEILDKINTAPAEP